MLTWLEPVGRASYLTVVMCALGVLVLPFPLYGSELWAAWELFSVVQQERSVYHSLDLVPVLSTLKVCAGLPTTAFSNPFYSLF